MSGHVAITYARMNPPTIGHQRLIDTMEKMFWAHDKFLFLSNSEDRIKNPLPLDYKLELIEEAFNSIDMYVMKLPKRDFFDAIKSVHDHGYSQLTVVAGSDRAEELRKRLPMYNGPGKLFNFWKIEVQEVPRDNRDIISSMSSTTMREAARKNDLEVFEAGLPIKLRHRALEIFRKVQDGCQVSLESL